MVKATNPTLVGICIQYEVVIQYIFSPVSYKVIFWAWLDKGIFTLIKHSRIQWMKSAAVLTFFWLNDWGNQTELYENTLKKSHSYLQYIFITEFSLEIISYGKAGVGQ